MALLRRLREALEAGATARFGRVARRIILHVRPAHVSASLASNAARLAAPGTGMSATSGAHATPVGLGSASASTFIFRLCGLPGAGCGLPGAWAAGRRAARAQVLQARGAGTGAGAGAASRR